MKNKIMIIILMLAGIISSTLAQTYIIDKTVSEIKILVYKNGILSGLAHNHIIVIKEFASSINWNQKDFTKSNVQIEIPIKDFIVDDSIYRIAEGEDFEKPVSDDDRKEIYNTMLDEVHLDTKKFPSISIKVNGFSGELPNPIIKLEINLHGITKKFELPVELKIGDDDIQVKGEFKLFQTDFNIEPHSAALGMIGVKDELIIKFNMKAIPVKG